MVGMVHLELCFAFWLVRAVPVIFSYFLLPRSIYCVSYFTTVFFLTGD